MPILAEIRCWNEKKKREKSWIKTKKKRGKNRKKERSENGKHEMLIQKKNLIVHVLNIKFDLCVVRSFGKKFLKRS